MQDLIENLSIELETIIESIEEIKQKTDLSRKLKQSTFEIKQLRTKYQKLQEDQRKLTRHSEDNLQKISQLKVTMDVFKPKLDIVQEDITKQFDKRLNLITEDSQNDRQQLQGQIDNNKDQMKNLIIRTQQSQDEFAKKSLSEK